MEFPLPLARANQVELSPYECKDIERSLNWKADDYVEIYIKDGTMIVQKAQEKEPKNR